MQHLSIPSSPITTTSLRNNRSRILFIVLLFLFLLCLQFFLRKNASDREYADANNNNNMVDRIVDRLDALQMDRRRSNSSPLTNVLVTGGCGFIGSHVVEFFLSEPRIAGRHLGIVVVLDDLTTGSVKNLKTAVDMHTNVQLPIGAKETMQRFLKHMQSAAGSGVADSVQVEQMHDRVVLVRGSVDNEKLLHAIFSFTGEKGGVKEAIQSDDDNDSGDGVSGGIGYVFHLAAKISVPESLLHPVEYERTNVQATVKLLSASRQYGTRALAFSSSAAVYGQNPNVPKYEDMKPECQSPYAQTKLTGEFYLRTYATKEFRTVALRYFNVFGERQDPNSAYAAAIPNFLQAVKTKKPITIHGDGEQTRDFVYVKDVVLANVYSVLHSQEEFALFNVGYSQFTTINDLVNIILQHLQYDTAVKHGPPRPGDVRHSLANSDRLRAIGWRPTYKFENSFQKTLDWFMTNGE